MPAFCRMALLLAAGSVLAQRSGFAASEGHAMNCSYPVDLSGQRCSGLTSAPSAKDSASCADAACSSGLQAWNWLPSDGCWVGPLASCSASAGWIGAGTSDPHPPVPGVSVLVSAGVVTNPAVRRQWLGCHSDNGYMQSPRGFYANLIYGAQFEAGTEGIPAWNYAARGDASGGGMSVMSGFPFNGKPSLNIHMGHSPATAQAGAVNRGIGNVGFIFEANRPYVFETFVWTANWTGGAALAFAELRDYTTNASLARVDFWAGQNASAGRPGDSTFTYYNITLVPSASTTCQDVAWGSDPTISCGGNAGDAFACQRCGGELYTGLAGQGSIWMGYASLMPGAWARLQARDGTVLPVLKSGAQLLTSLGTSVLRFGGSVSQAMRWTDWRGPVWYRPSAQQVWGSSLLAGWGPFEVIDMCNTLGIEPLVTLAYDMNSVNSWANLVEYCWGDPETTAWGRQRAEDGHVTVFNVTLFELGNEQYNPNFVDQVAAMEARANAIGAPPLHYVFPENLGLTATDAQRAVDAGLPIDRILPDLHVNAGGAVEQATQIFTNPPVPGFNQGAFNGETNTGTHDMQRALTEAADLIDYFTADAAITSRIYARTASFCTGMGSHFDSFNQAMAFFLPNATWLQPPGHVHAMIAATWAETSLLSIFDVGSGVVPFAAQRTADGKTLVLRVVNNAPTVRNVTVRVDGAAFAGSSYTLWTLSGNTTDEDNTPAYPERISPVKTMLPVAGGDSVLRAILPSFTFAIFVVPLQ